MKNNPLKDIIDCTIDISSPSANDESFDSILIIADWPTGDITNSVEKVFAVSSAEEVKNYGYKEEDELYKACSVAFSQNPCPSTISIIARKKEELDTVESCATAVARANEEAKFYGICLVGKYTAVDIEGVKTWAEANEKLFAFTYTDIENFPVVNTVYNRTAAFFGGQADGYASGEQPDENKYFGLAVMAKCFGYEPGSETWAHKEVAGIVPAALSASDKQRLDEKNVTSLRRYAGANTTFGGKTLSGEWIDIIRFRDWIKAEIQNASYNVLKENRKVPYTDAGINLIYGAVNSALAKGQRVGGIMEDSVDDDGNTAPGYTITVPKASSFSEAERKSRKLTRVKWEASLSGAIHLVNIHGDLKE